MTTLVKFKGISLELGGKAYVVPPLNLGALEQFQDRLEKFSGGIDPESVKTVIDVTHAALQRNYPDITRNDIAELIDVGNMSEVMQAVMDVSGLRRRGLEASAVASADPSIGADSTPT